MYGRRCHASATLFSASVFFRSSHSCRGFLRLYVQKLFRNVFHVCHVPIYKNTCESIAIAICERYTIPVNVDQRINFYFNVSASNRKKKYWNFERIYVFVVEYSRSFIRRGIFRFFFTSYLPSKSSLAALVSAIPPRFHLFSRDCK